MRATTVGPGVASEGDIEFSWVWGSLINGGRRPGASCAVYAYFASLGSLFSFKL